MKAAVGPVRTIPHVDRCVLCVCDIAGTMLEYACPLGSLLRQQPYRPGIIYIDVYNKPAESR